MSYKAIHIICDENTEENLSFLLNDIGYSGTSYENGTLIAYCPSSEFDETKLTEMLAIFNLVPEQIREEQDQNWNQTWEENFKDSDIGNNIHVRAPFQPEKAVEFDIVILPKMAFGTGHHETTQLTALALEKLDCEDKSVLDMGCGSGILAILASKKKAKRIVAIDYDIHSVENTNENVQLNQVHNVEVLHADNVNILTEKFDIIISNIVRNINLSLLPQFVAKLKPDGTLLLCGFLENDAEELKQAASAHHLSFISQHTLNGWLQTQFVLAHT
ncbi:MAG: ribosomal protein methyltransferase [Bacteroidota bacterium]|jgi:ribosomal protein L11 methyltransferase